MSTEDRFKKIALADAETLKRVDEVLNGKQKNEAPNLKTCNLSEASKMLGISRPTVYRMIQRGDIATVRIMDSDRVLVQSISDYVEAHIVRKEGGAE